MWHLLFLVNNIQASIYDVSTKLVSLALNRRDWDFSTRESEIMRRKWNVSIVYRPTKVSTMTLLLPRSWLLFINGKHTGDIACLYQFISAHRDEWKAKIGRKRWNRNKTRCPIILNGSVGLELNTWKKVMKPFAHFIAICAPAKEN